jgi:NitT/TauT family transport system substrate-binding protein
VLRSSSARTARVAAVASLALLAAACSSSTSSVTPSSSGSPTPTVVHVSMGIEPWIGYAPWYIAAVKGYFAKHNLNVNIVNFQTDADRNTALLAGKTDVSNIDTGRTVQFAAKSQSATPILIEDASTGADAILSDKSISTAADLKGQSVAYEFGTTSDLLLHYYLLKNNMANSDVKSVNIPAANAGSLIIAGKSKVAVTYEPYITEATSGSHGANTHVFFSSKDAPGLISDYLVANPTWLKANAQAAKDLILAWDDAIAYFNSNRADAVAIMAKGVGATPDSLTTTLAGVKLYSVADNKSMLASGKLAASFQSIGKTYVSMGTIPAPQDFTKVVDLSFLP